MIKINFYQKQNCIVKFTMDGHAGFSEGDDIVCAAASSAMWMTVNGIENVAKVHCGYEQGDGHVFFVLPDDLNESEIQKTNLLLKSFLIYIKELEEQYPDYIKLTQLEV